MREMTNREIAEKIAYAYVSQKEKWADIAKIAEAAGLNAKQIAAGIRYLMETDDDFRAEPQVHRGRLTAQDRAMAPKIGGEPRHLMAWIW